MRFTALIATLGLLSTASAQSLSIDPILNDDVECPAGSEITFLHDYYMFNAPMKAFKDQVGSFFEIVWTGGVATDIATGPDNTPGSSRSGVYFGGRFNETLTMILDRPDSFSYTYHGVEFPVAIPGRPKVIFYKYAETMRVHSICGGRATYMDLVTSLCTDNPEHAYDLLHTYLHDLTFHQLAANVNATAMYGDCLRDKPQTVSVDSEAQTPLSVWGEP
ncbi:hypothetical protein B0H15DRAFT_31723 [Mycena belliarum]|uniref:Uncharacterized protein n=1 Tax=Mycena belliarum TaxID=1033014 RepID=A0AAD6UAH3_9AGAR|nr:hypothetical protein B0H15DRAFT_31723 [Mycena belliae]